VERYAFHWTTKLTEKNKVLVEGLQEIRQYLNSEKFSVDIMVNKNDILLRISEIFNRVSDLEFK
jgi:hypothetical protein